MWRRLLKKSANRRYTLSGTRRVTEKARESARDYNRGNRGWLILGGIKEDDLIEK